MIHFKIEPHHEREADVVEVWDDDEFIATIYPNLPGKPLGVRLITKYGVISQASFNAVTSLVETQIIKHKR